MPVMLIMQCCHVQLNCRAFWAMPGERAIEGARLEHCCKCRLAAFDNVRQVQVAGLLVHRPDSADDFRAPDKRSV